jgi:glycosyltransferase involved in cell wall biosynthesis
LVIGGKDCHLFREIYNLPEDGYSKDILFPGWIDQADLPAVYSQADLFLYPSNLEAFPIPITEAMVCGTPIITSNVNGLVEIAGDAAVFVDPRDAEAIADAISQVLDDGVLQEKLSKKGLARSVQFSWDQCAAKTLNILEELVEDNAKVYVH